MDASINSLYDN